MSYGNVAFFVRESRAVRTVGAAEAPLVVLILLLVKLRRLQQKFSSLVARLEGGAGRGRGQRAQSDHRNQLKTERRQH